VARLPYIKWFPADYFADTPPVSPTTMEWHGIYRTLIDKLWLTPQQRFPNDDAWLALHLGGTVEWVKEKVRPIIAEHFKSDGNFISQKRVTRDAKHAREVSQKQSVRSKARWGHEKSDAGNDATAMPRHPSGNAAAIPANAIAIDRDSDSSTTGTDSVSRARPRTPRRRSGEGYSRSGIAGRSDSDNPKWRDEQQRLAHAHKTMLPYIPATNDAQRWQIIMAGEDANDANHRQAVRVMLAASRKARADGKACGWVSPERRQRQAT
jgi:uncharacterized protein YdaU (DUF1376 family)